MGFREPVGSLAWATHTARVLFAATSAGGPVTQFRCSLGAGVVVGRQVPPPGEEEGGAEEDYSIVVAVAGPFGEVAWALGPNDVREMVWYLAPSKSVLGRKQLAVRLPYMKAGLLWLTRGIQGLLDSA